MLSRTGIRKWGPKHWLINNTYNCLSIGKFTEGYKDIFSHHMSFKLKSNIIVQVIN